MDFFYLKLVRWTIILTIGLLQNRLIITSDMKMNSTQYIIWFFKKETCFRSLEADVKSVLTSVYIARFLQWKIERKLASEKDLDLCSYIVV